MNNIVSDILDGFYELADSLTGTVEFILSVFIGAFIAIRVFYIQKRHERMADKYEEVFTGLRVIIDYCKSLTAGSPTVLNDQPFSESDEYQKFDRLVRASRVYFNAEVKQILEKLDDLPIPPSLSSNPDNFPAYVQLFIEFHEDILEQLVDQAQLDLRPNLWQFTKEFFTTFFCG